MKFKDLENIKRNKDNSDELYDLTEIHFQYEADVIDNNIQTHTVDKDTQMRLDLVSNDIYQTVDYVDFLCDINNIINPLSIKENQKIIYVSQNLIPAFRPELTTNNKIRSQISNKRKRRKIDPNRQKFLEEKSQSLPPTITKKDYNPVKYKDGKISIGDNIFKQ